MSMKGESLVESQFDFEPKHIAELKNLYLEKERNYLEVLYFQILRNSNEDKFQQNCLMNFFSFSEYLSSKIFQVLSNKNEEELKLNEFIRGVNLLFSKFLPRNGEQLTETIFKIISNNSETITYLSIKEFANNILFDCFCKAQIYEFEFFLVFSKNLSRLIKKVFSIGKKTPKLYNFNKNQFKLIVEKNPFFIKILIILFILLSPINENLILKLCKSNKINIFDNDDFENEFEFELDKTPRINSIPKENSLNFHNFSLKSSLEIKTDNRPNKHLNTILSFGMKKMNEITFYLKDENQSGDSSFESIDENNNKVNQINKIIKNQTFSKNNFNEESNPINSFNKRSNRESYQGDFSTDISGIAGSVKNRNKSSNISSVISPFSKDYKSTDFENKISDIGSYLKKINDKYSNCSSEQYIEIQKSNRLIKQTDKDQLSKEYSFTSNENEFFPSKDMRLLKYDKNNGDLFSNLLCLYNEMKISQMREQKFQVLLRKVSSLNIDNSNNKKQNFSHFDVNNTNFEDQTYPFIIKFIENDLILYYTPSNDNSEKIKDPAFNTNKLFKEFLLKKLNFLERNKYYIYFYNLKNIILSSIPNPDNCEYTFTLGDLKVKYFRFEFTHINQIYELFFESYQQLVNFHEILSNKLKNINRSFFLNTQKNNCNFDLLLNVNYIFEKQKQFSVFHKLVDKKTCFSLKLQSFNKSMIDSKNLIFLKKIFDTCKINNFLSLKIFPIANFYETNNNIIVEYTDDDFRIKYDQNLKNFVILMKTCEIRKFLIEEIGKFQKLVKLLNYKENMSNLFELINMQKTLIYYND